MQSNLPTRSSNPVAINIKRGKGQTIDEVAVTEPNQIVALKGNELEKYLVINLSFSKYYTKKTTKQTIFSAQLKTQLIFANVNG